MTEGSAPPTTLPPPPTPLGGPRRARRPAFGFLIVASLAFRFGREIIGRVAFSRFGFLGFVAVVVAGLLVLLGWRWDQRRRIRARGGQEFTAASVVEQLAASGLEPPAFVEDGTLLGASVLLVNQRAKLLEVVTEYEIFGADGRLLGTVRQIGQTRGKKVARVVGNLDQFFTHHFEICDPAGQPVLRLTRPRKFFRTKLHVFDGANRFVGEIRQRNVFGKIKFEIVDGAGTVVGHLRAQNLRAWDFVVLDRWERPVASIVKSWEGWARTAFTRADRYAVRIAEPLPEPLRQLTFAAALAVDLALKQDARGLG